MNKIIRLKDITWGGRIRVAYQQRVWEIASQSAIEVSESTRGNMLSSSSTTSKSFLDGCVSVTSGYFDASSGMHWYGEHVKAYILYKLGFDARALLKSKTVPSLIELEAKLKNQLNIAKQSATQIHPPNSHIKLNFSKRESKKENREKLKKEKAEQLAREEELKLNGPKNSEFLFEAYIWEDISPYPCRCYIEKPNENICDYRLWEKTCSGWKLNYLKVSGSVNLQEAARQFLVKYFGHELAYNVVSFEAGPILGTVEYKDLIRPPK